MQVKIFQVDAFAEELFEGNPAAVCPLDHWLPDARLQAIALENNLSETAFFRIGQRPMEIRWFTPETEVRLCGHATLASAHVLHAHLSYRENPIRFQSLSGPLNVIVEGDGLYTLDFPEDSVAKVSGTPAFLMHFDQPVREVWRGKTDFLLLVDSEETVRKMQVDYRKLRDAEGRGFIVTAEGKDFDYVSRCFYPQTGINEDPGTGSSHTTLAVFWSEKLGKTQFSARQLSERGASFETERSNGRVLITGHAVSYLEGTISV